MNFEEVERNLNYTFKDKNLLKRALTLSSADSQNNNQTLEFFGDAILEFIVSEKIFDGDESEGNLTEKRKALVADSALTPVSIKLGLDRALIRNPYDNRNKKAVPSAYEAVVAAIYLDGGIDHTRNFVYSTLDFKEVKAQSNFIGELQELLQGKGERLPEYKTTEIGDEQSPLQRAEVIVYGKIFTGTAVRKQEAKQSAARQALEWLKKQN